jgi:hypothetical protein
MVSLEHLDKHAALGHSQSFAGCFFFNEFFFCATCSALRNSHADVTSFVAAEEFSAPTRSM